jgi:hypothetical protein
VALRFVRRERVVFREIGGSPGGVLLDLDSGDYRRVNEMGALVWRLLERPQTRKALVEHVRGRLKSWPPSLETEVDGFLDELVDRKLVARR